MTAGSPAITISGLRKSYGDVHAVAGVDLTIQRGEVFGLLGPNGAGKTTMIEILVGQRARDGGELTVLGFDPAEGGRAFRDLIGIVPELVHTPPTTCRHSTTATRRLSLADWIAAFCPAGPDPITRMS